MLTLLHTILQQNYFTFQNIFQPDNGIAIGSPVSRIIAEIFLQSLKNSHLKQLLKERRIIFYTRYVDIVAIYNRNKTTPGKMHNYMKRQHPSLKLTPTPEQNNSINFLDLLIT
jgi:hypothetical protein